jgi:formyl-CoA transferase
VNTLPELFADPQVLYRVVVVDVPHPGLSAGVFRSVKPPATLHETPGEVRRHPPLKGEHTAEVLGELGMTEAEISDLAGRGVVWQMPPTEKSPRSEA